jgi:uncharacterized membrane protein
MPVLDYGGRRKLAAAMKALSFIFLLSTAFYTRGVFLGYDSPPVYASIILGLSLLALGKLRVPSRFIYAWACVLFSLMLSGLFSQYRVTPEKALTQSARAMLAFGSFVIAYASSRLLGSRAMYRSVTVISVASSVLGISQFLLANLWGHILYLPPTNPSFMETGGPGAIAGDLALYRASGTFPEPSWLASYLLMGLLPTIKYYVTTGTSASLVASLTILAGLASTGSLIGVVAGLLGTVLGGFLTARTSLEFRRCLALVTGIAFVSVAALGFSSAVGETGWPQYVTRRVSDVLAGTDPSGSIRKASIQHGIQLFLKSPVFGIGIGQYSELDDYARVDVGISSGWMTLLVETGLFGVGAWGWLVITLLRHGWSCCRRLVGPVAVVLWWVGLLSVFNWWYDQWYWSVLGIAMAERSPGMIHVQLRRFQTT